MHKSISVIKEKSAGEQRVILTPREVGQFIDSGFEVFVEMEAGNIALNARLHGLETGVVSNLGSDRFSAQYRYYLRERGVTTDLIHDSLDTIAQCVVSSNINHSSSKKWIDNGTSEALRKFVPSAAPESGVA